MQPRIQEETERYTKENQRRKRWQRVISMLTCVIVFCTTYALILPAITLSGDAACGMAEHTHSAECYALAQTLNHVHTVNCTETVCSSDILVCAQEEHTHTLSCYADPSADLETAKTWEATMARADMSGGTASDLLAVAWTQVGYKESEANYIVLEDGATIKGYTRYGQWNGTPYEDWSQLFVKFCLYYAGISEEDFPRADGNTEWRSALAYAGLFADGAYTPEPGDLIFLEDYVGIVSAVSEDGYVTAIFGDYQNEVRTETFTMVDPIIAGYGNLPELENSADSVTESEILYLTAEIEFDLVGNTLWTEAAEEEKTEPAASTWSLFSLIRTLATTSTDDSDAIPDNQDLANHMNGSGDGVSIQYKESDSSSWTNLTGNLEDLVVGEEFLVQFTINYTLSGGTLSSSVNTMYYQLPINQLLEARSGNVRDNSGTIVGTYTIDTNGLVTVTFLDYYVNQNAAGSEIAGSLSFTSDIYSFDTDGDYKVKLEESSGNYIEVTLKRTIENDLTVDKTAGTVDLENGTVSYTITVSSNSGTSDEVVLTDTMTNGTVDGSFTVVDKNGNPVNVTAPSDGSTNFTLTLPAMAAGDTYTITYTAELASISAGQTNMTNAVTVKSNLGDDKSLTGSDEITVPFDYSFGGDDLKKSYTVNSDGTLSWTVTIDASAFPVSMEGWTLSDTFNGEPLASQVTIQFTDGTATYTGTLPYEFTKDHTGTITVTYTTSTDYGLGMNGAVNKASLNPPDDPDIPEYPPYEVEKNYLNPGDYWVQYNPLEKEYNSSQAVEGDNGTYGILNWTLTIDNEDGALAAGWKVTDSLTGDNDYDHYYTPDQETAIKNAIVEALTKLYGTVQESDYTLTFWGGYEAGGVTYPNTGFTLTVNKPLEKGTVFTIEYSSTTAVYESTTQHYTNVANLNGKVWASDTYTHYPPLLKVDGNNNSHAATSYDLNYLSTGLINWRVYISPTAEMAQKNEELIVIEDIPDDPVLNSLQFNGQTFSFAEGSTTATVYVTVNGTSYGITAEQITESGNKIVRITIPKEIVAYYVDQRMTISVEMDVSSLTLNDPVSGATDLTRHSYKILDNKVTIYVDGEENDKTEDSQEQTVYKPSSTGDSSTKDETTITKTTEGIVDGYVLPYTVTVNAEAEDLDSESDWLQVDDVMKFTNWNVNTSRFSTALDTSDVYITLYNADGTVALPKTALVALAENETPTYPGGFVYTQESEWMYGNQEYVTSTINFTIPDGYKAVLEYQYAFYGTGSDNTTVGISNTAILHKTGTKVQSATSGWYKITESDAQANLRSINIYKVDAYNYSIHLAGAEYDLYKYDAAAGKYEYIQHITSNGLSELEIDTITVNTAYFLVETKAPAGYILDESLHYFMIRDDSVKDDDGNVTYYAPSDFPSDAYYNSGGIIYITNERYTDKITVNKQWYDAEGNLLAADDIPEGTHIELKLYQVYSNYPVDFDYGTIGQDANLILKVGKYSYTEEYLNASINGNTDDLQIGDTVTITYTFTEAPLTDIPGLIHVLDTEYNQIPFTVSQDSDGNTVYTFRYRITEATSTLRGHIGESNVDNLAENGIKWYVDTPFENADHARSVSTYQYVTLSAANNWAHTFYDLPAYLLSENGQIQGYYSYYVNEISSSLDGYTPTYSTGFSSSTSIQNGTIAIENKPPTTTELSISKKWDTESGAAPEGVETILVDLYRIAESTNQDQRYVDINFNIGTWSGQSDYYSDHIQVEAGSTVRLTMKLKGGSPLITSDASSIPLTETVSGPDADGYTTYMYTFVASSDVNIRGHVGTTTRQNAAVAIVDKPDRTVVEDELYIEGIQISSTAGTVVTTADGVIITSNGNWSVTVTNLPTVGMTENGNPLYYSYYIKENGLVDGSFKVGDTTYFPTYQAEEGGVIHHESPTVTGGSLTVINTPVSDEWIEFEVVKAWVDSSGNPAEPSADSIEFRIWQTDKTTGEKKLYKTVALTAAGNWNSGTLYVPSSANYTYTVEEIGDYNVTYSYTAASEGTDVEYITDGGTVTIQNEIFTTVLPTTGGAGTLMYTLGGLAMCGWTLLRYNKKRGRKGVASS